MKTSNKILTATSILFLGLVIAVNIPLIREYKKTKPYASQVLGQLSTNQIHTLITEKSEIFLYRKRDYQSVSTYAKLSPETVLISGDTLLIRNIKPGYFHLPHLRNYIADGIPQSLPNK